MVIIRSQKISSYYLFIFIYIYYLLRACSIGHAQWCSGLTLAPVLRKHSWLGSGVYMGWVLESNPGHLHTRKVAYWLYNTSVHYFWKNVNGSFIFHAKQEQLLLFVSVIVCWYYFSLVFKNIFSIVKFQPINFLNQFLTRLKSWLEHIITIESHL